MPELHFKGKEFVYNHHLSVPYRPLVIDNDKSVGATHDLNNNLIIHGDNLHALKALMPLYAGKVDCVFIDPPYNTGNEGWCYNDNVNSPMLKEWLESNPVGIEDGLRHDKWCAMMYPRLKLLSELLTEHGIIFVTIDDYESHRLQSLMDEIFGIENFLTRIVARLNPKGRHLDPFFAKTHEYVLVYAKDINKVEVSGIAKNEDMVAEYNEQDEDGKYRLIELRNRNSAFNPTTRENLYYPIFVNPETGNVSLESSAQFSAQALPLDSNDSPTCWTWGAPKVKTESHLLVGRKTNLGKWRVFRKDYLVGEDGEDATTKPKTVWLDADLNMDLARKTVSEILGSNAFDFPKPVALIKRLIELVHPDALILDSFAGSGTTAQAVLAANSEDGGNRRFILCECMDYADTLTAERVRRVINGYAYEGTRKEVLYRKKLNFTSLKRADRLLDHISSIENLESHRFDDIKKVVKDGELIVTGEKNITEKVEGLGGSFTYCTLGEPIDLDGILTGQNLPSYEAIGSWLFHTATGDALDASRIDKANWYLGETSAFYVWLVYKPELEFLKSRDSALTLNLAENIAKAKQGKKHLVFAPAKFVPNKTLLPLGVEYAPLPFSLYKLER
jgi:adenine-specific DNA-methyltransferase